MASNLDNGTVAMTRTTLGGSAGSLPARLFPVLSLLLVGLLPVPVSAQGILFVRASNESGVPVAIERRGRTLLLVAENAGRPRLAALKRRKLVKGDAADLAEMKVGEWREPKNLG